MSKIYYRLHLSEILSESERDFYFRSTDKCNHKIWILMKRFLRLFSTADTTLGIIFFVKTRDNGGETWNILVYFGEKQQNICKEKASSRSLPEKAFAEHIYFLKKSGILIDCSFTLLVGVLGTSRVGEVPPAGFLGIGPPAAFPFGEIIPISSCGACAA